MFFFFKVNYCFYRSKSSIVQSLRGDLYSVNQILKNPTNQIEISINSNPSWAFLQVINACSCTLLCRLENISTMSHIIPPFSSTFIGIDSLESPLINNNNDNLQNLMNGSRFYLSQFLINENSNTLTQLITDYFQQNYNKKYTME